MSQPRQVSDRRNELNTRLGENGSLIWPHCGGLIWPHPVWRHAAVAA